MARAETNTTFASGPFALVSDDLLVMQKPDAQQAIEDLAREFRGVPDICGLDLSMTVTDPKIYSRPWVSEPKKFGKLTKEAIKTWDGWTGLMGGLCAPADEVELFNKRIRDSAGRVIH